MAGIQVQQNEGQEQMRVALGIMQEQLRDLHDALISSVMLQSSLSQWERGMEVQLVIIN